MHKTEAGENVKALKKEAQELARRAKTQKEAAATMRAARVTVTNLQALADKKLSYDSGSEAGSQAGRSPGMGAEEG